MEKRITGAQETLGENKSPKQSNSQESPYRKFKFVGLFTREKVGKEGPTKTGLSPSLLVVWQPFTFTLLFLNLPNTC